MRCGEIESASFDLDASRLGAFGFTARSAGKD